MPAWDAVVIAGGRARRLGGVSKPDVLLAGRRLIDHTLTATAGAREVVVVGPAAVAPPGVRVTQEEPPGGGPVAGLAAGVAALPVGSALVLVLACDVPRAAGAVDALLAALTKDETADAAALVDADGRVQSLVALYRRGPLEAALVRVVQDGGPAGTPMRALLAGLALHPVPDRGEFGVDVDTWPDLARAEVFVHRDQADVEDEIKDPGR